MFNYSANRIKVALISVLLGLLVASVKSQLMARNEGIAEEEPALGVEPANSTIWGPGLAPHSIVLPARYFFVQLVGPGGRRYAGFLTRAPKNSTCDAKMLN